MPETVVYSEVWDVDARLRQFGVTRPELIEVVKGVVAARADVVDDDPLTAEGLFAYIYGTRHLRGLFKSKGWQLLREDNIEAVWHPKQHIKIIYQNVDIAASQVGPRAISGKGPAADRMIDSAQGRLFTDEELTEFAFINPDLPNSTVWFFCVSVDGEDVRAELSLPASIEGRNFNGYLERIFILRGGEWGRMNLSEALSGGDVAEFEPLVTRR